MCHLAVNIAEVKAQAKLSQTSICELNADYNWYRRIAPAPSSAVKQVTQTRHRHNGIRHQSPFSKAITLGMQLNEGVSKINCLEKAGLACIIGAHQNIEYPQLC